jgi:tripartite-type tricarboxylate transporter receptor subunit TctC
MKRLFGFLFLVMLSVSFLASAASAGYPDRQINMLVGLAPGGSNDIFARTLAEALKGILPQPVVVVNKTGGSASIATSEVVHTRPDGYNLLTMYSPAVTILPHTNPNLPYKGPGNLQFVSPMGTIPIVLGSRSNAPWKTLQEMVEYARKNPGKVKLGHTGIGSLAHLAGEDLNQAAKVDISLVPFTGTAPVVTAILGGHVDLVTTNPTPLLGALRAGSMRVLGIYTEKRSPAYPDVPTLQERGFNVGNHNTRYVIAGPKGLPKEVVQTLYNACTKAMKSDSFQKFAQGNEVTLDYGTLEEIAKNLQADWGFYETFLKKVKLQ